MKKLIGVFLVFVSFLCAFMLGWNIVQKSPVFIALGLVGVTLGIYLVKAKNT